MRDIGQLTDEEFRILRSIANELTESQIVILRRIAQEREAQEKDKRARDDFFSRALSVVEHCIGRGAVRASLNWVIGRDFLDRLRLFSTGIATWKRDGAESLPDMPFEFCGINAVVQDLLPSEEGRLYCYDMLVAILALTEDSSTVHWIDIAFGRGPIK